MMRNFDERKKEILRRAEARIAHRKKVKRQVLGIGVPMLCLAICLGAFLHNRPAPYWEESPQQTDAPAFAAPTVGADASSYDEVVLADVPADNEPSSRFQITGNCDSEYTGVSVCLNAIMEGYDFLEVNWVNETDLAVEATDVYDIEFWQGESAQWVSCMTEQPTWSGEPFAVQAGVDLGLHSYANLLKFDLSRPGEYRFTTAFHVAGEEREYTLWTYFQVLDEESVYPPDGCVVVCTGDPTVPATPTEPVEMVIAVDAMGAFGSDYPGVYLECSNIFLEEGIIQAFWRNETALPARLYEGYDVQYLDGDTWVSCKKEYPQFGENIYELDPWPSHLDMDYSISPEQFDLSRPGEYRLTAQFWVEGDDTLYTAWAWFTLAMVVVN